MPKEGWEIGKEATPELAPKAVPGPASKAVPGPAPEPTFTVNKANHPPLQLIFFIALGFGLAAAGFAFFSNSFTKTNSAKQSPKAVVVPETIVEVVTPVVNDVTEKAPPEPEKPIPALSLSGILFGETGSFALINGRVIPEGGNVEGAVVEKIYAERVELSFEGKKITLRSR